MEPKTFIKKSPMPAEKTEGASFVFTPLPPELDFPIAPDFHSVPPHLDPVAMYWRCEELMRQGARPPRRKCDEDGVFPEFIL